LLKIDFEVFLFTRSQGLKGW